MSTTTNDQAGEAGMSPLTGPASNEEPTEAWNERIWI